MNTSNQISPPVRGVGWVLRWAATFGVLALSSVMLTQFFYCLAAERALARAVQAGALEATLPRATGQTVVKTIDESLQRAGWRPARLQTQILVNSIPMRGALRLQADDRLAIRLRVPTNDALPNWLNAIWPTEAESFIEVHTGGPVSVIPFLSAAS